MKKSDVYIIIPSYNEGEELIKTIKGLSALGYNIVVVDDCSTFPAIDFINNSDIKCHCLRHLINLGQGAALQTGTEYALKNKAKYVVHFDADGQHPVEAIDQALSKFEVDENLDIVMGSRFLNAEHTSSVPKKRRFVLKVARLINYLFTGLLLTDAHNGFRVISAKAIPKLVLTQNRMSHATEVLNLVKKNKLNFIEIPIHVTYTDYSMEKGQSAFNSINILFELIIKKIIP